MTALIALSREPTPDEIAVEQALLGAVILNAGELDRVRSFADCDDFAEPLHRHIFDVLCRRRDAGESISLAIVRSALGDADLGGLTAGQYVARLAAEAVQTEASDFAKAVRRGRQIRDAQTAATDLAGLLNASSIAEDPTPHLREAIEALDGIVAENAVAHLRPASLASAARAARERAEDRAAGRLAPGVPFGLPGLDRATHGIQPGQLVILAGRPGMGKSTTALHFTTSAARAGWGVGYFSLEMNAEELGQRAMSAVLYDTGRRIPYQAIAAATGLREHDLRALYDAEDAFARLPVEIDATPGLTVSQIAARTRRLISKFATRGVPLGIIVVDHLGLIRSSDRYRGSRVNEISETTGALKTLARELNIGIVLCSQLNRGVENKPIAERRPSLADLRDSGSIEQDADLVLALFREAHYLANVAEPTPEETARLHHVENRLEIEILKQRQGPTLRVECFCDIGFNIIGEMQR